MDLPSPWPGPVTRIVFTSCSRARCSSTGRADRYASAARPSGSAKESMVDSRLRRRPLTCGHHGEHGRPEDEVEPLALSDARVHPLTDEREADPERETEDQRQDPGRDVVLVRRLGGEVGGGQDLRAGRPTPSATDPGSSASSPRHWSMVACRLTSLSLSSGSVVAAIWSSSAATLSREFRRSSPSAARAPWRPRRRRRPSDARCRRRRRPARTPARSPPLPSCS